MLERVVLENFKSWKTLDITLGRVTGLFGANSSGKSSLLQFLLLLKQTKNATDRGLVLDFGGPGQLVNLGGYRDVIHGHDVGLKLEWEVKWSLPGGEMICAFQDKNILGGEEGFYAFVGSSLLIKATAYFSDRRLGSDFLEYGFDNYLFSISPEKYEGMSFELRALPSDGEFKFIPVPHQFIKSRAFGGPIKAYLYPDEAKLFYVNSRFLSVFESKYESMMDSIHYLGPLRAYPERQYSWSGASPLEVGSRGERTMEAILSATLRDAAPGTSNPSFQEKIAHWLKELKLIHEFSVKEIAPGTNLFRAMVRRDADSPETLLTEVGFGVSQILPALVLLHYVPEGSTILMEQPEIHLHPSVQSGLADVILSVAKERNLQVIVESHSEHMLRRFQRRVAESAFPAEEIKLYFCDYQGGESKLVDLQLDEFGEILNWPPDFFGDEMTEIAETRKAILRRKREKSGK